MKGPFVGYINCGISFFRFFSQFTGLTDIRTDGHFAHGWDLHRCSAEKNYWVPFKYKMSVCSLYPFGDG